MTDVALRFTGFGWRYAGRRGWAVRGLDLEVGAGERVLLLGASGAGKSTVLTAAAGLLAVDGSGDAEGTVEVGGVAAAAARDRVGLVFQDPDAQVVLSRIGDDVAFGLENLAVPAADIWPRVDGALAAVGLGYGRDHRTDRLSGGEKQRLALAGALSRRPDVLLLDEPTANLDPPGAGQVRAAVGPLLARTGATLLLVEHRIDEWLPLVDRVVVLEPGGGVAHDGPPDAVLRGARTELIAAGVWVPGFSPAPRPAAAPPGPAVVTAHDLAFRYPGATADAADAVDRVDVELRTGEALAVTGANGSGKSTLGLLLGGLLRPAAGRAYAGPAVHDHAGRDLIGLRARDLAGLVGSVFQQPEHQFVTMRVRDELALGPSRTGASTRDVARRVDELLDRLRLARLADANPYALSGGEKRRLSVATALATRPTAVLLDEPTFGQDLRTWRELLDLLAELRDGGTGVLAVTHDRPFAAALADRTLTMAGGRLAAEPLAVPS